jgi:threonine aldolase
MMVVPKMIYISHPTEYGTLYSKEELTNLRSLCDKYGMKLFLDGARLGYGIASRQTDVTLNDIASLCHVFYIGGTKVGALCGEAVVFAKGETPERFLSQTKQHGAMLAKGRLLGVQFEALFEDGLYFEISKNAIDRAEELKELFASRGYEFFLDSPTNQQFVILNDEQMERISQKCRFGFWEKLPDGRTVVRFATSFATTKEEIDELAKII